MNSDLFQLGLEHVLIKTDYPNEHYMDTQEKQDKEEGQSLRRKI